MAIYKRRVPKKGYEFSNINIMQSKELLDNVKRVGDAKYTRTYTLTLTWDDIANAHLLVGDAANLTDWNTFFDLPTFGNPFTGVTVTGNDVLLEGGSNIIVKTNLIIGNNHILSVIDTGMFVELEDYAFRDDEYLAVFEAPNLVIMGEESLSYNYRLQELYFPKLTTAGVGAMSNMDGSGGDPGINSIDLPVLVSAAGACFENNIDLIYFNAPLLTVLADDLLSNCTSLVSVSFPLVTIVGDNTFTNCTSMTSLSLPLVTTIGYGSFSGMISMLSYSFPLVTVTYDTFYGCTAATSFNLPNVTSVGDDCFGTCAAMENIVLSSCITLGNTVGNNNVFDGISAQTINLTVPAALMTCNGGNPDGDIQYLVANNTVTVIQV